MNLFSKPTLIGLAALIDARRATSHSFAIVPTFAPRNAGAQRPCPQGIAGVETAFHDTDANQTCLGSALVLTPNWMLVTHTWVRATFPPCDTSLSSLTQHAPKTWHEPTLERIHALLNEAEAFDFALKPVHAHTPRGEVQETGRSAPAQEWVNQGGGGLSGDDFHGTITWRLNGQYLIAHY